MHSRTRKGAMIGITIGLAIGIPAGSIATRMAKPSQAAEIQPINCLLPSPGKPAVSFDTASTRPATR